MSCVPFSSLLIPSNFNMFDLQRGAIGSKRHDGLHSHRTVKRSDVFGNRKQYFPIVLLQSVRTQSRQSVPGIVVFLAFRSRRTRTGGAAHWFVRSSVVQPGNISSRFLWSADKVSTFARCCATHSPRRKGGLKK